MKFSSGRFVAVMASLLALAGCGLREEEAGSEVAEPVDWATCGDIECATIRVPLDHFAPEFKQAAHIELRAYRTVSEAAGSRHQTLVIHPGGPGADVRAAVARARTALAPIIDDFDIYALSTRGSVDGTAFDCGETLGDIRVIDAGVNAAERFAERCSEKSAELIGRIGTRQSVEDLEEFRSAIGVDRVRYLGWSYGATLGATWAMTYPGSIRSMVLDAPSDPRRPWADELSLRYLAAADAFARGTPSTLFDAVGNFREVALAREYVLYEPSTSAVGAELVALRLGETSNGNNDGGIETQIGVHCSDVSHSEARDAIAVGEPTPRIGFGAAFDWVCLELAASRSPLTGITVDRAATRIDVMVVSSTGDHVIPAGVSQRLAREMLWRNVVAETNRHLAVGFDAETTKKAMSFLASGD